MFSVLCSCNWWLLHFAGPKTYSFSSPVDSTAAVAANLDKSILKVSIFMWNSFMFYGTILPEKCLLTAMQISYVHVLDFGAWAVWDFESA